MKKIGKNIYQYLIIVILLVAFSLRIYNVNWDQFHHVHPDERMITMVAEQVHWPVSRAEFGLLLTPQSPLNPQFFAYGSFPIYLLRIVAGILSVFDAKLLTYDYINLVGRMISAIFDTLTVFLIFRLGKKIKNEKVGILAAVFYTLAVFPIQAAHFYAVDVMLTFFILLTLYFLAGYLENHQTVDLIKISIACGGALAIKVSAILLLLPICLGLLVVLPKAKNIKSKILNYILKVMLVMLVTGVIFAVLEPYALIDFQTFWRQTQEQSQMTKNAFTFPYTLQYVGTTPYLYHLKNMILWGMGIPLGILSVCGLIFMSCRALRDIYHKKAKPMWRMVILLSFFWLYFLTVGSFAIKFMRYFLPLYPLFILFAVEMLLSVFNRIRKLKNVMSLLIVLTIAYGIIYSISFLAVYSRPHVRATASDWMINNIPTGSVILREHWDDGMPLSEGEKYQIEELKLYDPDTDLKWQEINEQLARTDYIVIASNRLYTPLQKLTDCAKLPVDRCYKQTAKYYKNLFAGTLGFTKVAEFSSYPTIPLINVPLDDQAADESFTVYDHPKIMIFKKVEYN